MSKNDIFKIDESYIRESFTPILEVMGIQVNFSSVIDLIMIIRRAMNRIRNIETYKLDSIEVGKVALTLQARIKGALNEVSEKGGNLESVLYSCAKLIEKETGAIGADPLLILKKPKILYKGYCCLFAVKQLMAHELIGFYKKYTGKYPVLSQDRDSIPNTSFEDFFKIVERSVVDFCKKNNLVTKYGTNLADSTTTTFLKKTLRKQKLHNKALEKNKLSTYSLNTFIVDPS